MALVTWSVDGKKGEVELDHLQRRTARMIMVTPAAGVFVVERVAVAGIVRGVYAYRTGGTGAVIDAKKGATSLLTGTKSLTSADTWAAGTLTGTAATLALAVGDTLTIEVVSVAGTPTGLTVQIDYEISDPA